VIKRLVVCLRMPSRLDGLLVEFSKAQTLVSSVAFSSEALRTASQTLDVKALKAARANAQEMAEVLGYRLGRPLHVVSREERADNRGVETYSTGGGVSLGAAATGALTLTRKVEADF
jgi:uncharacterized protein YggE